ncbi:MAG TPA: hypothetical protein VND91_07070 [Candidatus Saccharimonadia bacterium]|nr:hypothetical protein [Candidatus Saccharimonadia bacterium]
MYRIVLIVAVLLLAACRDRDDPPPDPQVVAAKPAPTVLDEPLEALDKARAVERDVLDNAKKADEALDAAEGG